MKKQLIITARRIIAMLLFPFWGLGGLYATVTVTPISADYANQKVTFKVEWNSAPYNNRVWIWIDFCPISDITPGSFSPATITGSTITNGSGSITGLTGRGFFIVGSTTNSGTTITATLNPVPAGKFNWCAYGSDMPPNATLKDGGGYDLHGTPPFTINDNITEPTKVFGAGTCITSITDLTGNPVGIVPAVPSITLSTGSSNLTATQNSDLPALKYTTARANGATRTSGSFPAGVSDSWANNTYTISGTPTTTGTFTYTIATINSQNCTNATATGTIISYSSWTTDAACSTPTIMLGSVGFSSSATYSVNGLILSSAVTATYCNKSTFSGGSSLPYRSDCRTSRLASAHLFSGCMVRQFANQLCPSPWRVPTRNDLCQLDNKGNNCSGFGYVMRIGQYGWQTWGGCDSSGNVDGFGGRPNQETWAWGSTRDSNGYNWGTYNYSANTDIQARAIWEGYVLRCVK
jgi:hypothetical protein